MHREALQLGALVVTLALTLLSCTPPVEPLGPVKSGSRPAAASSHDGGPASLGAGSTPIPPAPGSSPKIQAPIVVQAPEGPRLCATKRPDLPRSFFEIRLQQPLTPEEHLLIGHWIKESLSQKFDSVRWNTPPCTGSFVCASLPLQETSAFAEELAKFLSEPPLATFYPAREAALDQARQLTNDPGWRVHTTMNTFMHPSPSVLRALAVRTEEKPDDPQADQKLERILEQQSGNFRLSQLSPSDMKEVLKEALRSAQATLAGPAAPASTIKAFEHGFQAHPTSPPPSSSDVKGETADKAPEVVRLSQEADNWSHASTAWDSSNLIDPDAALVGLSILAERIRGLSPAEVIVDEPRAFQQGNVLALDLRGPYEQVLEAVQLVREQSNKLISAAGKPNLSEIKGAHLSLALFRRQSLEPRCISSAKLSLDAGTITNALRRMGRAHSVVWGRAAEEQSDDAP